MHVLTNACVYICVYIIKKTNCQITPTYIIKRNSEKKLSELVQKPRRVRIRTIQFV